MSLSSNPIESTRSLFFLGICLCHALSSTDLPILIHDSYIGVGVQPELGARAFNAVRQRYRE